MPYKCTNKLIPKEYDKRVKLLDDDKRIIKELYDAGTHSQRQLAREFNVSRRLIQFIVDPAKLAQHKANQKARGSKIYYDKDTHTTQIREHRRRKKQLDDLNLLKDKE